MKILFVLLFVSLSLFGAQIQNIRWQKGETFLTFLEKYKIPFNTYFQLSKTDKELCTEILAGTDFETLIDEKGNLIHALIPISDEMQIHIKKDKEYKIDFVPISYFEFKEILSFNLKNSIYDDIMSLTNNASLANEFVKNFKESFDFKKMKIGDLIKLKYKQKVRSGRFWGTPDIDGVYVESNGQKSFLIKQDDEFYDDKGRSLRKVFMKNPIPGARISSTFTLKRYHPVLKYYRAHLGVDYAANVGTKIFAAADGKISFRGIKGGYGKTVVINHASGYQTLYGHLSGYTNIKIGGTVKQGTAIAFSGNSGLSSGPHLHFGVYKNSKAVDPIKVIKTATVVVEPKRKKMLDQLSFATKKELLGATILNKSTLRLETIDFQSQINLKQ